MRMLRINKHLIPLKVLLFFLFGAFGCLWPFLPVHMKKLGLRIEETAIINFVAPFVGMLGPPLANLVASKTQKGKVVLIVSLVVCAVCFSALLFVPPTQRHAARSPSMFFTCGVDGGFLTVERCDNECRIPARSPSPSSLGLRSCHYVCDDDLGAKGPGPQAPVKPYICVEQDNGTFCHVYNASGDAFDVVISDRFVQYEEIADTCLYPMIREVSDNSNRTIKTSAVQCRIENSGCAVHCKGFADPDDPTAMSPYKCQQIDGKPLLTFGAYLLLRIVAEFFMYASLALLDATILNSVWEFGGFYSQQFLWGMLAVGLLSPIVGLMIDYFYSENAYMTYAPAFVMFDFTILITVILIAAMPANVYSCVNRLGTYMRRIWHSREVVALFVMTFFLGTLFGFLETFSYWYLDDRKAEAFFLGATLMVGIFPSLPLLFFGDQIVKKCNHANVLIAAFFAYMFRCVAYSVDDVDIWHILPFDTLRIVANFLMWIAAMTYCEKLGPKVLASTISGTVAIMHSNAGRGIGALAGGYVMAHFGSVTAFRVAAIYAGTLGVIYLALYHFYLKFRRSPIFIETAMNGHYTPMETYVNGENQVQKPMLADRDRY